MADKYILRVTAGPSYDTKTHQEVRVNEAEPIKISSDLADIELNVRIRDFVGLPMGSPRSSAYFEQEPHKTNGDQYSICFRFTPKKPAPGGISKTDDDSHTSEAADEKGIPPTELQFGNDLDKPIRDHLPPGINTALRIVKWWIDPGMDGDVYADRPHLYGPALSSFNVVHCGAGSLDESKGGLWFEEGGDEAGMASREELAVPRTSNDRMKWALSDESKSKWVWEFGKTYGIDFFNPYLDFNSFSLRLPGFQLGILRYWDGQPLRYVLRKKSTGEVYLVITFSPYLRADVDNDGNLKASEEQARQNAAAAHSSESLAATTSNDTNTPQSRKVDANDDMDGVD